MKKSLDSVKMNNCDVYTTSSWVQSFKVVIAESKKKSIEQHNVDRFSSIQRAYSDENEKENDVTAITMNLNWKKKQKLKNSQLTITYHEKFENFITNAERLADVALTNSNNQNKTYKIYSNNQTSLKLANVMQSTFDQLRLKRILKAQRIIENQKTILKLHWIIDYSEILNNETTNNVTNKTHEFQFSFAQNQRYEIAIKLTLIRTQNKQIWKKNIKKKHKRNTLSKSNIRSVTQTHLFSRRQIEIS